jgi:hypothetical protein
MSSQAAFPADADPVPTARTQRPTSTGGQVVRFGMSDMRFDSPVDLLNTVDALWRPLLGSVSLVAEAEIPVEDSRHVASALGVVYARLIGRHTRGTRELARWPACTAGAMIGAAVSGYEAGTYWPALWKATRYTGSVQDQTVWGQAFTLAIERLNMPAFAGLPLRYLGPILMHAGIPAYCLGDYFRLLLDRRRRDPGMDADSFIGWATLPGHESRLFGLDVPARRFLNQGGEYAHDVVDRSLDLLERLGEPDPDLAGIRLPAYVIQAARSEVEAGRLDLSVARRRAASGQVRHLRPRIGLDPFGEGVQVILPPVGDAPDGVAVWRVTADGAVATVQSRKLWVGTAEAAPQTSYPLSRPVRSVLISLGGRDLTTELQVVDPADPVLFFADDGRQIPGSLPLPPGQVWILHPEDHELLATGEIGEVVEPAMPFGWEGWRLRLVTLDNAQDIRVREGRTHSVHGHARPRLVLNEPVHGVTTPYGSPVYHLPPRLILPGTDETPITWSIEIRPAAGGPHLLSKDIVGPAELDLGQHLPRPIIGAFEVTVRGPLGRGMRRTIFIAERLAVSYQPTVRLISADGLRPNTARLAAAIGASVIPRELRFLSRELAHVVEYQSGSTSEPLVVTPPHVSLLCPGAGVTTWTAAPLHLTTETFADAGLLVRVPDGTDPGDLEVWVGGTQIQDIPPGSQRSPGLVGYELARALDTITEHGRAELVISHSGTAMIAGTIRPRRLASGIELDGDQIRLLDYRHVDGLMAGVYLVFAPWRGVSVLPIFADGIVVLPEEIRQTGPFRVLLRIEDLWIPSNWPSWPGPDSYICRATGSPRSDDAAEASLSRFVAGDMELPELVHPVRLWQLVHLAGSLVRSGARPDLAERCGEGLCRQPTAALLSLLDSGMESQSGVTALIASGVAAARPQAVDDRPLECPNDDTADPLPIGQLWSAFPAAAAILTGHWLTAAIGSESTFVTLVEDALAQCGDTIQALLDGENDPYAAVGRFGADAEQISNLSPEQVEALWHAAAVVPQALLDADTRMTAARQMFDARRTSELRQAAAQATSILNSAEWLIRQSDFPELLHQLASRRPLALSSRWLALPAISMGLALVARLAAHGDAACRQFEPGWRKLWAGMADHAPDLVAMDLVLAELLIAGTDGSRMPRSSNDQL